MKVYNQEYVDKLEYKLQEISKRFELQAFTDVMNEVEENYNNKKQLEQAKEIIKEFFRITTVIDDDFEPDYSQLIEKAEAFIKERNMANCKKCGYPIQPHYTYCKKCYYELGSPYGTVVNNPRTHKCRRCGTPVQGRYYYCQDCAVKIGFMK